MTLSMTLGALAVVSGVVAIDRERGYVRFLFSAPVRPWAYYLARFVVGLALFAACFAAVPLLFGAVVDAVPVFPVVQSALLYALFFGALVTFAGAITRFDGQVTIGVAVVAYLMQTIAREERNLPGWAGLLARALPPVVPLDGVRADWLAGRAADTADLVLVRAAVALLHARFFP